MTRSFLRKILLAVASAAIGASSLMAGNIALTGHDNDFHASLGNAASNQLRAMIMFARAGAPDPTKPVLTFDAGSQLTGALSALGIPFTNVNPNAGVPAASLFDVANFSAMAVASDQSCGGCSNSVTSSTNIAGAAAAIAAFFNAGGGIVALAAGSNNGYYSFLPTSASGFGSPPSTGYVQTAFGASLSIPAVNGNATHNFFFEPGTGGVSAAYGVVERLGDINTGQVMTIACAGCTVAGGGIIGGGGGGGGVTHPVTCFNGPVTTDVPVTGAVTTILPGPAVFTVTSGNLGLGLRLNHDGTVTGTPGAKGTYPYTVAVTDATGTVTTAHCALVVNGPGAALAITTACPLNTGTVGTAFSQTLTSTGGVAPLAYSLSAGSLPAGLTLSAAGVVSGTPTAAGTATFTLHVTDSSVPATTASRSCSMTVNSVAPPAVTPPTITTACPLHPAISTVHYSQTLVATGTGPITWSLASGSSLPSALTLTSAGLLSGVPAAAGTYNFTITATNSGGSDSKACSLVVTSPHAVPAPTINNACPLASGTVGTAYSQTFTSTNGVAPLTYSLSAGSLPAGLALSSGGVVSGTPTAAGTSSFTVLVTDSSTPTAQTGSKACSITVNAAPPPATAPTITTACPLPGGTEHVHYSTTLASTGGTAPYTYSLVAGELPRPLLLSSGGVISGAPYHAGTYNFTLQVTGADGLSSQKSCSLVIAPAGGGGVSAAARGSLRFGEEDENGVVSVSFKLDDAAAADIHGRMYLLARSRGDRDSHDMGFVTGGREVDFVIEAGQTVARFPVDAFGIRVGDHSADLVVSVVLEANRLPMPLELTGSSEVPDTGAVR